MLHGKLPNASVAVIIEKPPRAWGVGDEIYRGEPRLTFQFNLHAINDFKVAAQVFIAVTGLS